MSYLIRIDASPRARDSHSRVIADALESKILDKHRLTRVVYRDLARSIIPHISQDTITGFYTPPEDMTDALGAATALSDTLIEELKGASAILISTPIYNFSIPSALKAWIDQIVRVGHTFAYENGAFEGLVLAQNAYLAIAYGAGGYEEGGPFRAMDFNEPYLRSLMTFLGVEAVDAFQIQYTTADEDTVSAMKEAASRQIQSHFS